MERSKEGSGMGSFDVPIKLTFSLDARRTVITEVVGQKKEERKWERKEGARNQMRRCHCRLILLCGLAGERCSLLGLNSAGGGDIWLSDDPILMSPIVARSLACSSFACVQRRRGGDDENGSDSQMFCYLIFLPSARPPLSRSSALHPTKEAIFLVRPCSPQFRKHDFGGSALLERWFAARYLEWFAAPIYLPLSEPSSRAIIRIYTSRRSPSPSTAGDPQRVNFKVVTDSILTWVTL